VSASVETRMNFNVEFIRRILGNSHRRRNSNLGGTRSPPFRREPSHRAAPRRVATDAAAAFQEQDPCQLARPKPPSSCRSLSRERSPPPALSVPPRFRERRPAPFETRLRHCGACPVVTPCTILVANTRRCFDVGFKETDRT
jgi:hypothetical protein